MGVLEQMRSGSDSTFMQVIFAMVIVAFVGMYMRPQGERSGIVATVNGVRIMDTDYSRAYRIALAREEQRRNQTLSDAEQKQLGERVRQDLIEREVVLQEAERLGLEVGDDEVGRLIVMEMVQFRDSDGKFSREIYERWLKRQQYTTADFEERIREDLLQSKLRQLAFIGASMSEPALKEAYVEGQTRVDLKLVEVRSSAFEDAVVISDEERAVWLEQNSELVSEIYERDFDRLYNHPEQLHLRMIRLAVVPGGPKMADLVPKLNQVREELEAGADFAALAQKWSEDPSALQGGDLGLRPAMQLSLQDMEALEGIAVGGLTRVFPTESDVRLLKLEERIEPRVETLEEVRDAIADRMIRAERVPALAASFAEDELLAQWMASGEVPEALLSEHGLFARDTGPIPTQGGNPLFGAPQPVLDAARTAEVGAVIPEVFEQGGRLFVAQLIAREEPDMAEFEEKRDEIRERVLAQRRFDFYNGWVADLKAQASIE
ncbi:MAG TPA: hypothetical protein ENK18_25310 [Deltaproteobacteria bacterium]|nr:hypothetical protein [Deltaproteobacteria bacterium]